MSLRDVTSRDNPPNIERLGELLDTGTFNIWPSEGRKVAFQHNVKVLSVVQGTRVTLRGSYLTNDNICFSRVSPLPPVTAGAIDTRQPRRTMGRIPCVLLAFILLGIIGMLLVKYGRIFRR